MRLDEDDAEQNMPNVRFSALTFKLICMLFKERHL